MLTSELPITERATSVLYHYTGVRPALDIVRNGEFRLSSVVGNTSEESHAPPGYPYFLSTTRSRTGDYHRYVGNSGVMFVLDGDYFNRHYKVRPIDYWERSWAHSPDRTRESEDRVFSREATIPAAGIKAIHVLLKTQDDTRGSDIRRLLIAAKKNGLPIHLYQDERAWRVQDIRRRLPINQALELLQGQERIGSSRPRRNYLEQWVELIHKKSTEELSEPARKLAYNIVYYNRGRTDDDMGLGVDLSNARKPSEQDHDTAVKLIGYLKKYDLSTHAMVKDLHDKWAAIKAEEHAAKKTAESAITEDADLMEVEMNPGAFQRFLKSDAAAGIRAGFEAELIFRNTQSDADGSGESEPDYDADERTDGIQDIIDFFQGGENPISGRSSRVLRSQLEEQFSDWVRDSFDNNYFDLDRFMTWAEENIWPEEDDNYREDARTNLDDEEASDEDIEREAISLFRDDVERDWDRSGDWYERARDELYDEYANDANESDWLDEVGMRYMSDVANEFGLDWPHWTDGSSEGGEREWQDIADGLERVTDKLVRVSGGYHGTSRGEWYVLEPDSSLDADDSDDFGLEVVSPPMPLPEAIEQLRRVIDWANSDGDAYTNDSTGLHMGVSLPFKGGEVDPIKLILFMGDRNILETFGRTSNHYARSAWDRLKNKVSNMKQAGPQQISGVMELMKKNLIELADRELQRGVLGDKYVSVNPHNGYIEFRGPGGDYLNKESEIEGTLENTMLRLAYAMSIAGSPELYRREYAKKLYKVLTGYKGAEISKDVKDIRYKTKIETEGENPFMRLFADYSAGAISGDELKRQWAETVLRAEQDAGDEDEDVPMGTAQDYEVFNRGNGSVIDTIRAYTDSEALDLAANKYDGRGINYGVRRKAAEKKPVVKSRRAELAKRVTRSTRDVGEQLWRVNHHSSVQYIIANSQAAAIEKASMIDRSFDNDVTRARLATDQERTEYLQKQELERQRSLQAQAGAPRPAGGGEWTGQWLIKNDQGRVLHRFGGIGNVQSDANRYAAGWLGRNYPELVGQDVEVVPEMR